MCVCERERDIDRDRQTKRERERGGKEGLEEENVKGGETKLQTLIGMRIVLPAL